jgi:hypothetical protein
LRIATRGVVPRVHAPFTARVAIPDSRSYYEFNLSLPQSATCTTSGENGPTNANIHAGQRVTTQMFVPTAAPAS